MHGVAGSYFALFGVILYVDETPATAKMTMADRNQFVITYASVAINVTNVHLLYKCRSSVLTSRAPASMAQMDGKVRSRSSRGRVLRACQTAARPPPREGTDANPASPRAGHERAVPTGHGPLGDHTV